MFAQQLVNGLTLGVLYALLALGYTMIFGTLGFINFAHGQVAVAGGYVAWFMAVQLQVPFVIACVVGVAVAAILGIVMERYGYKPVRFAPKMAMITVSVGFSFILQTGLQLIFGTEALKFTLDNSKVYTIGSVQFSSVTIIVLAISVILMVGLQLFIKFTKPGRGIRAVSLDMDTAGLMGVDVNSTISMTFGIGSGLGAISAIMMCVYYSQIYPMMGTPINGKAFCAAVLGGVGSVPGAMLGGVVLGLLESAAGTILSTQLREAVAYIVLIFFLIFKPAGIIGKEVVKD